MNGDAASIGDRTPPTDFARLVISDAQGTSPICTCWDSPL
jgi:hypothetical protein